MKIFYAKDQKSSLKNKASFGSKLQTEPPFCSRAGG